MKRCLVLINSRVKKLNEIKRQVNTLVDKYPEVNFIVKPTILAGDTFRWAYDFSNTGGELIITCGGDGTINEVLNGAFMNQTPKTVKFGHYACGSANDLKRTLPKRKLEDIFDLLLKQELISTPGAFLTTGTFKRWFVNESTLGMGALVCRDVELRRKVFSPNLNFLFHSVYRLLTFKSPVVEIKVNDKLVYTGRLLLLVIGKGKFVGNGLGFTPQADYTSSEYGITILTRANLYQMAKFRSQLMKGRKIQHENISYLKGESIEVKVVNGLLPIETDGEYYNTLTSGEKVCYKMSDRNF